MAKKRRTIRLGMKIALYTFVFGAIVGIGLTLVFSQYTRNSLLVQAEIALTEQAHQATHFVDALLSSKVEKADTIAANQALAVACATSNAEFAALSDEARIATIQALDTRWQDTASVQDPFIAQYLGNDAAQRLSRQTEVHPGEFGEIFLTDRFGALVATTGKLTTFAHGHKPWWLAGYNEGQGAVFLDDRGYDISVGDYVLGVVVPVLSAGEVVGILKCNYSILTAIGEAITVSDQAIDADIMLVRSNGLIVYGQGKEPLQSAISDELTALISERESGWTTISEDGRTLLAAFREVPWTAVSSLALFGGTPETVDHRFGNSGESWVIVVFQDMEQALAPARMATMRMALIAAGFIFAMAFVSLILGLRIAKPVRKLATQARSLGSGQLDARVAITSRDEIGRLAASFNEMADHLEATMVSRDELSEEVAQRQLVEAVLRQSETRYRTLFENMINGFSLHEIVLDKEGNPSDYVFLEVNSAFEKLTGLDRNVIIGKKATDVLPGIEHDPADWIGKYGKTAITGAEARFEQHSQQLGKWFSVLAFRPREGQFATIFEDITARKQAEEEKQAMEVHLRQQQKLESLGTMARGVAHEINNPLMGMINYADLIKERVDDEQLSEFAGNIMNEGNRVAKIVHSLLSFSRQETVTPSLANIKDIIDSSLTLVGSLLRGDQITVELDIPEELPQVRCLTQQIQQVLINVLINAQYYLNERYPEYDEDKILKILVRPFEENGTVWVRITVEDHGFGIPEEVIGRVFDPFFSTKPRHEGSGLGLSVSFGIVREHQGKLSVESEPGQLTRFHIDLPASVE